MTAPKPNPFGEYVREKRLAAKLTLREVAAAVGISMMYLSEVERGVRGPLRQEHWGALADAIPGVTPAGLKQNETYTRGVQLDLAERPPEYQRLGVALARRFKREDLSRKELEKLLRVIGED